MPYFTPAQIRDAYIEKCKYTGFSNNLKKPTEARIRNACIDTYYKKNTSSDKWILRNFLGVTEEKDLIVALKEDVGKFRPVVNFLKNKTEDPRDETIELIAWLIDFKFESDNDKFHDSVSTVQDYLAPQNQASKGKPGNEEGLNNENINVKTEVKDSNDNAPTPSGNKESQSIFSIWVVVTVSVIIIVFGGGGFLYWQDKTDRETITKDEKCMYWNGNNYEAISCEQSVNTIVIPLNIQKLKSLKKITDFDTLTESDLGKVWYAKVKNRNEYFTDSGMHPVDTAKRLKPLTPYILSKYVSYHRHQLKMLIWFSAGLFLAGSLAMVVYKFIHRGKRLKS